MDDRDGRFLWGLFFALVMTLAAALAVIVYEITHAR